MNFKVLLDIDGTIAPFKKPTFEIWDDFTSKIINSSHIIYSPKLLDHITELSQRPKTEFIWATNWFDHAVELFPAFTNLKVASSWKYLEAQGDYIQWKFDAIQKLLLESSEYEQIILIDDDAELILSFGDLEVPFNNFKTIIPNKNIGLTREHIDDLHRMLK